MNHICIPWPGRRRRRVRILVLVFVLLLAVGIVLPLLAMQVSTELAVTVLTTMLTSAAALVVPLWRGGSSRGTESAGGQ